MSDEITTQLQAELSALRARLESSEIYKDIQALERVIRLRGAEPGRAAAPSAAEKAPQTGRQESATSVAMKDAAAAYLATTTSPVQTKEVLDALESQGVHVPGDNPQNNLSAHMSRDHRFLSLGREGWVLASTVTPRVELMKEVATQYLDGQDENSINQLVEHIKTRGETPATVDRDLLALARTAIRRNLTEAEKRELRRELRSQAEIHQLL